MKKVYSNLKAYVAASSLSLMLSAAYAQVQSPNVFDDIIVTSTEHTILEDAINAASPSIKTALRESVGITVFAPTDAAFAGLLPELGYTNASELLANPDLDQILLYHVLGSEVLSTDLTNGTFAPTLQGDSIFVSTISSGAFIDQAKVLTPDLNGGNGTVHIMNDVLLPQNSIIDVAVTNGFTILTDAVVTAELAPALVDPISRLTVFAPTDAAFAALLPELGYTNAGQLLANPNLDQILLYHVLGSEVLSTDLMNGNFAPTLQGDSAFVSVISSGAYIDQAMVTMPNVDADNGVVHVMNDVLLPQNSIIDVAVTNGFTILTDAVVTAELAPALVDPISRLTVFAPTDAAFTSLATSLGTDANGLLALSNLQDILLYHVIGDSVPSNLITTGAVNALNGEALNLSVNMGDVMVNDANVTNADVYADNGIIHIIDAVLLPISVSIDEFNTIDVELFPNPTSDYINVNFEKETNVLLNIYDINGKVLQTESLMQTNNKIDLSNINSGTYILQFNSEGSFVTKKINIIK